MVRISVERGHEVAACTPEPLLPRIVDDAGQRQEPKRPRGHWLNGRAVEEVDANARSHGCPTVIERPANGHLPGACLTVRPALLVWRQPVLYDELHGVDLLVLMGQPYR